MRIFRVKTLTLVFLGCLFLLFLTLVFIDIFDGSDVEKLISEPEYYDTYRQLSPGEESEAAKMSPKQIQSRQWNRIVFSVIAKYFKKGKGFTLYKEDLAPEDRLLLESFAVLHSENVFYNNINLSFIR